MKAILVVVVLGLVAAVVLLFVLQTENVDQIVSLRGQINSLQSQIARVPAKASDFRGQVLVVGGLQMLSSKGNIVADLRALGEQGQIQLQSFSETSVENGRVLLTADGGELGSSVSLSKRKSAEAIEGDYWATYGVDGFYIQRGIGMDMKNPKEWVSTRIGEYGAIQQLNVVGRGAEVGAIYTAAQDAKDGQDFPISLGLFGTKSDGSKGGPSLVLTNNYGLGITNDDGMRVVDLTNVGGTGSLTLSKGGVPSHVIQAGDNAPDTQKGAFQQAVALEANGQSLPIIQGQINAYMKVIAQDPTSDFGKAAAVRVSQLEDRQKEMEHLVFGH